MPEITSQLPQNITLNSQNTTQTQQQLKQNNCKTDSVEISNKTYKGNKIYNTIQGFASPGTVQLKNKEYKKGAALMGGYLGSFGAALGSFALLYKTKGKLAILGLAGTAIGIIGAVTTQILSAKDANKNTEIKK